MEQDRYFFVVQDPEQADEKLDITNPDQGAQEYADRIIGLLKEADGYDHHGLVMVVRNNAGQTVFSAPF